MTSLVEGPSILSVFAAILYGIVVVSCVIACFEARSARQPPWQRNAWIAIACFFGLLIVSRLLQFEDLLRTDLREWLRLQDLFSGRRAMQGPIIAVSIGVLAAFGFAASYWMVRRVKGRRNLAIAVAGAGSGLMLGIIMMRVISLHAMDFLLYGPPKLNWVGDIGASLGVLAAAAYYTLLLRGRLRPRPR